MIHPQSLRFLAAWHRSVKQQDCSDFELWLGIEGVSRSEAIAAIGEDPRGRWVEAEAGETGVSVRLRAMTEMSECCESIIFVDSDDLMERSRVAAARAALKEHDVVACSLKIIDEQGADCGCTFGPDWHRTVGSQISRYNVFGLSNTAYRSGTLRLCLPFPSNCVLVDWFLATRAWLAGARLWFDPHPRMFYRQYGLNTARVLPPFTAEDVSLSADRVLHHYELVLPHVSNADPSMGEALLSARRDAAQFKLAINRSRDVLNKYTRELNALPPRFVWWWTVANPQLEHLWRN